MCLCVNWVKKRDTLGKCLFVHLFFWGLLLLLFWLQLLLLFEVVFVVVVVVAHAKSHECICRHFQNDY